MNTEVLNAEQIEQFIELGYVRVPQVFSSKTAAAVREFLWQQIELSPDKPDGWTQSVVHLQKSFTEGPFADALTPKFWSICNDLMGEGRWGKIDRLGWWPVSFPGFETQPWSAPEKGWHVDGQQFHHHLNSRDQGILSIFLFSDIEHGDGGTAISVGSHKITARVLEDADPEGLDVNELARRVGSYPRENVLEATGQAGDVFIMHPFMLHARSINTGNRVRFICNPCVSLHEPMDLRRSNAAEYSLVESAIVQALESTIAN
ncbi:MAG: phytanoyl-CoA dioxygenase family protein [Abditibacteriaceae bacterium]